LILPLTRLTSLIIGSSFKRIFLFEKGSRDALLIKQAQCQ
jgi:hypothetical protein